MLQISGRTLLVTATAGLAALLGASTAGAATVTGGGSFFANAGGSRLVVNSTTPVKVDCLSSTASGAVSNGTYTPIAAIGTVVPAFPTFVSPAVNCTGPFGFTVTVACQASAAATLNITANPVAGRTSGAITGIACVLTFPALGCSSRVTGSVPTIYANPGVGGPNGILTVTAAGQSLTTSGSTCPATVLPNGLSANFGAPVGAGTALANLPYTLTTSGPIIS